jgi:hypothetical protein
MILFFKEFFLAVPPMCITQPAVYENYGDSSVSGCSIIGVSPFFDEMYAITNLLFFDDLLSF